MKSEVEVNYLFVKYIQQSIKNASNAFLKKKQNYSNKYFPTDKLEDNMITGSYDHYLSLDSIKESDIIDLQDFTENESLSKALNKLTLKEKNYCMRNMSSVNQIMKLLKCLTLVDKVFLSRKKDY